MGRGMKPRSCGDCRWSLIHPDAEYGACSAPAPGWAERADPAISKIGDGADYARWCPFYYAIGDYSIEKGGDNE